MNNKLTETWNKGFRRKANIPTDAALSFDIIVVGYEW
jgi:hypothetical protein